MVGLALYYVPLYGDNPSLHLSPYYQGQRGFWNTHINQAKIPVPLMYLFCNSAPIWAGECTSGYLV